MHKISIFIFIVFSLNSCSEKNHNSESEINKPKNENSRPLAIENGKFFSKNDTAFLYGGENEIQHFDISNCDLKDNQFHYGIGREEFPALLHPEFYTISEANAVWTDEERFLVAHLGKEVKAYAIKDLTRHEVINDVLDGQPIMAAYCVLADLGAIYKRNYGADTLTFALSGYTYFDSNVWNGLDGFVLWDRETESLWWPLVGKAVSGKLKDVKLLEMSEDKWEDTTWGALKIEYPNAKVLKSGQDYERPKKWKSIDNVSNLLHDFK